MSDLAKYVGIGILVWAIWEMIRTLWHIRNKSGNAEKRLKDVFVGAMIIGIIGACLAVSFVSFDQDVLQYLTQPTLIEITAVPPTLTPIP